MSKKNFLWLPAAFLFVLNTVAGFGASDKLTAKWIWAERKDYRQYNDFIVARKRFAVGEVMSGEMVITADSRYRLYINGEWVNDGPCRSWPKHYQYDVVDVTPYLQAGDNEIRVIANFYGTGTFWQVCQQAGLLVELDVKSVGGKTTKIVSDESWEVADVKTWRANMPKKCVQMGPYEIYDARKEGKQAFRPATVLFEANKGPWKGLNRRDCALLSREPFGLRRFVGANVVAGDWLSYGVRHEKYVIGGLFDTNHSVSMMSAVATVVRCEEAMTINFENFGYGGYDFFVNGTETNRSSELKVGENFLLFVVGEPLKHWNRDISVRFVETEGFEFENPLDGSKEDPWCFIPMPEAKYISADYKHRMLGREKQQEIDRRVRDAGMELARKVTDVESFKREVGSIAFTLDSDTDVFSEDPHFQFQRRRVIGDAMQLITNPAGLMHNNAHATVVQPSRDGDIELIYDLGEQNCGYYEIDLIAEGRLEVDIAEVENIAADGRVQHTAAYRNSMRYVCKEGRNKFMSMSRRSGRYMFIYLRNQTKPVRIRNVRLIESTYPVNHVGYFNCSDTKLDKLWEISARTLKLCMEDTFTDCPLYEQVLWVGDSRNEAVLAYTAFGAEELARRCILLAGHSLDDYPIVLSQVPSTWGTLLPTWSYLWGRMVWDYYYYTGDKAFIEQVWPMVIKNLEGAESAGYMRSGGPGSNMVLIGAVNAAMKCDDLLGDDKKAAWLSEYRERLVRQIDKSWDDDKQGYVVRRPGGSESVSLQANYLSLLHDVVEKKNHDAVLRSVLESRDGMKYLRSPIDTMNLLEALEKEGHQDLVMKVISEKYQPMLEIDSTTTWEHFPGEDGDDENGFPTRSHCHGWSAMPVHFFNRIILGIVPTEVGGKAFTISPRPSGLSWAKGASATINGPVEVSWSLESGTLNVTTKAPKGVDITFASNDSIEEYDIVFNGKKAKLQDLPEDLRIREYPK